MKHKPITSDLQRIDRMKDEDIDYSDIAEVTSDFFQTARAVTPPGKRKPPRPAPPERRPADPR